MLRHLPSRFIWRGQHWLEFKWCKENKFIPKNIRLYHAYVMNEFLSYSYLVCDEQKEVWVISSFWYLDILFFGDSGLPSENFRHYNWSLNTNQNLFSRYQSVLFLRIRLNHLNKENILCLPLLKKKHGLNNKGNAVTIHWTPSTVSDTTADSVLSRGWTYTSSALFSVTQNIRTNI